MHVEICHSLDLRCDDAKPDTDIKQDLNIKSHLLFKGQKSPASPQSQVDR